MEEDAVNFSSTAFLATILLRNGAAGIQSAIWRVCAFMLHCLPMWCFITWASTKNNLYFNNEVHSYTTLCCHSRNFLLRMEIPTDASASAPDKSINLTKHSQKLGEMHSHSVNYTVMVPWLLECNLGSVTSSHIFQSFCNTSVIQAN